MVLRTARIVLIALTGFLAVTAMGGGLALLAGFGTPPPALLAGTPFSSYFIPGLCLFLLVGGLSLFTTFTLVRKSPIAPYVTSAVGFAILIFEFVEILAIGSPPGVARNLQVLYFSIGIGILGGQTICFLSLLAPGPSRFR